LLVILSSSPTACLPYCNSWFNFHLFFLLILTLCEYVNTIYELNWLKLTCFVWTSSNTSFMLVFYPRHDNYTTFYVVVYYLLQAKVLFYSVLLWHWVRNAMIVIAMVQIILGNVFFPLIIAECFVFIFPLLGMLSWRRLSYRLLVLSLFGCYGDFFTCIFCCCCVFFVSINHFSFPEITALWKGNLNHWSLAYVVIYVLGSLLGG